MLPEKGLDLRSQSQGLDSNRKVCDFSMSKRLPFIYHLYI